MVAQQVQISKDQTRLDITTQELVGNFQMVLFHPIKLENLKYIKVLQRFCRLFELKSFSPRVCGQECFSIRRPDRSWLTIA